jgi:hypothetical protein
MVHSTLAVVGWHNCTEVEACLLPKRIKKDRRGRKWPRHVVAVWFSFWAASGRQKLKLKPNAQILARLLGEALG